jgi:quercetin dioxygenase-like cupin family protein
MKDPLHIERWNDARDGPLGEAGLRAKLERLGYEVTRYVYRPGTRFPEHSHGTDKMDAVVSGRFRITIEGHPVVLEAGDAVAVPRGVVHSAEVVGVEPVVSLDGERAG